MLKLIFGLILLVGGVVLGIWLGVYVMFIGGLTQFINAIKSTPVPASELAFSVAKMLFAGVVGIASCLVVSGIGYQILISE